MAYNEHHGCFDREIGTAIKTPTIETKPGMPTKGDSVYIATSGFSGLIKKVVGPKETSDDDRRS